MGLPRIAYRTRQFWNALRGRAVEVPEKDLAAHLTAAQLLLFRRMHPSEQAHACKVLASLKQEGQEDPHLLQAALLHDVGKVLSPLSLWDRVIIVLGKRLFPAAARRWGWGRARGLRRPFVVSARHAEWGAQMAAQAGAAGLTVELIRRHQDPPNPSPHDPAGRLLAALQQADEAN